ncbi:MAG: response regulator transcription factor [Paludibacteraceae bacterium]|nr:response regulator transcription factor [Paludibacteraceae bacterium]MBN2786964.1 response regulator transcription factor [Paludibacteraceae bacterium]
MKILVVEDEPKLATALIKGLKVESYLVDVAYDGEVAIELALVNDYDIILLDYLLPKRNGLEVLKEIRNRNCLSKVLMLTAKDAIQDKVDGLNMGADDYMVKPFAFEELLARIRVLLRRGSNEKLSILMAGDLSLNLLNHEVFRAGKKIDLSVKEYALLEYFLRHQNELVSRTQLWEHVWEMDINNFSNVVDVYVCYLRNKIDKKPFKPLIHTLRGKGYILKTDD